MIHAYPLLCPITECPPVGNLRDFGPHDKPVNEYGLFILPQPIHYTSGRLISVTTNVFYKSSAPMNSIRFVLFRQMLNGSYCEAFRITSVPIADDGSVHRTITIHVNRTVMAGDLIGLENSNVDCRGDVCFELQPVIQSNNSNDALFYSSTGRFTDRASRYSVYLNMEASIVGKQTVTILT